VEQQLPDEAFACAEPEVAFVGLVERLLEHGQPELQDRRRAEAVGGVDLGDAQQRHAVAARLGQEEQPVGLVLDHDVRHFGLDEELL
jgi:hypothetical protein